ncbi:MAG: hypothetical protein H0X30_21035 [Anaerolineae bacterium]|nr:hypothetical protein [Anaerolineae bacterium]
MSPVAHSSPLKMKSKVSSGTPLLHGGGIERGIRCIGIISAAATEAPAGTKSQFGGLLPQSRCTLQRK